MKKFFYFTMLFSFVFIFSCCSKNNSPSEDFPENSVNSILSNTQNNEGLSQDNSLPGNQDASQDNSSSGDPNANQTPQTDPPKETVATEFSTKILTSSKNRATNIKLTCEKINEKIVKSSTEFSFCQTVGVSKESEGYKKADVIVGDDIVHALGGGNCQVSSTLYNAVLNVPDLEVTERHPHGKDVNYVPEGKDAAIAHGSKDFRFKNNSTKDLKMYASSDDKNVYVKLVFLE